MNQDAGETAAETDRRDRAVGALLGLAVGDALGTTLEFRARDSYPPLTDMVGGGPFGLAPGEWTDDTAMALALGESLLARGDLDLGDLMNRFVDWWRHGYCSCTGTCFDIGIATSRALQRYLDTGDPRAGATDPNSAGNGCIMRLAPVAIRWLHDPIRLRQAARDQARTTHGAPECLDASALFAGILARAIGSGNRDEALAMPDEPAATPALAAVVAGGWRGKRRHEISAAGWVTATFEAALWAVSTTETFEGAVLAAANLGEDADTVAAVTGQIAGALYGAAAIPPAWRRKLSWHDQITDIATRLFIAARGTGAANG